MTILNSKVIIIRNITRVSHLTKATSYIRYHKRTIMTFSYQLINTRSKSKYPLRFLSKTWNLEFLSRGK